jgi:hypothetical protein
MPSVFVVAEERTGLLSDVSYILGKEGVRMQDLGIEVAGGKAVVSLTVRDPQKARDVLRNNGFDIISKGAVLLKLPEYYKKMEDVKRALESEKIFLKDWKLISGSDEKGIVAIHVDKPRKAIKLLCDFLI